MTAQTSTRIFARVAFAAAIAAGFAAGCDHRYEALTASPPGLVASLDSEAKQIRVTEGVSLAFECFESASSDEPCSRDVSVTHAATAQMFAANLDNLTGVITRGKGPQTRSAFVVVGIAPGQTQVSAGGDTLDVTVLATDPKR